MPQINTPQGHDGHTPPDGRLVLVARALRRNEHHERAVERPEVLHAHTRDLD